MAFVENHVWHFLYVLCCVCFAFSAFVFEGRSSTEEPNHSENASLQQETVRKDSYVKRTLASLEGTLSDLKIETMISEG